MPIRNIHIEEGEQKAMPMLNSILYGYTIDHILNIMMREMKLFKKRLRICKVEGGYIIKEWSLFGREPYVRATPDGGYILYKTYEDCLKEIEECEKGEVEEVVKELFI